MTGEETARGEGHRVLEPFEQLLEPAPRNTAPAIGIAALRYRLENLDPVLVILPSDHVISDVPAFQSAKNSASELANVSHFNLRSGVFVFSKLHI